MTDSEQIAIRPPAGAFWRGAAVGIVVAIPLVIATAFALSRLGIGDPGVSFSRAIRFALVFAAVPAVITAGGVARVAGRAALVRGRERVMTAVKVGAAAFAPAGVGLLVLTVVPLGILPEQSWRWIWLAFAGGLAGAAAGAAIGRAAVWHIEDHATIDPDPDPDPND
jgi:hypothetical protein